MLAAYDDTMVNSQAATTNYSAATTYQMGSNPQSGSYARWAFMRFDLSSIPVGAKINAAALRLVASSDGGGAGSGVYLAARKCKRAYVAAQATWNIYSTGNNWGTAGARADADRGRPIYGAAQVTSAADGTVYTLDISPLVQEALDLGQTSVAIIVQCPSDTAGGNVFQIHSMRAVDTTKRPKLTVDYSGTAPYTILQPTGVTVIDSSNPTANYSANAAGLMAGYSNTWDGIAFSRNLLSAFDLTNAPAAAAVDSVWLRVVTTATQTPDSGTGAQVREMLRAFVANQATWLIYSTGNNWQTAGAEGASDRGSTLSPAYTWTDRPPGGRVKFIDVSDIVEPKLGSASVVRLLATYLTTNNGPEVWLAGEADAAPALLFLPSGGSLPQRY